MTSLTPPTATEEEEDEEEEEEEDTELRDLVTNVLSSKGILGKIKAELRAQVYHSLQEGEQQQYKRSPQVDRPLQTFLQSSDGRLLFHLVREFLSFFDLRFSLSVFDPETTEMTSSSASSSIPMRSRDQLIEGLGLGEQASAKMPLLAEILRLSKVSVLKSETPTPTERTEDESSMPSSLEATPNIVNVISKPHPSPSATVSAATSRERSSLVDKAILDGTFILQKDKESPAATKTPPRLPSAAVKPAAPALNLSNEASKSASGNDINAKPSSTSSNSKNLANSSVSPSPLGDLPKLGHSSSSPLGSLPPLGGGAGGIGGKKVASLAPLKKVPIADNDEAAASKTGLDLRQQNQKKTTLPAGGVEKSPNDRATSATKPGGGADPNSRQHSKSAASSAGKDERSKKDGNEDVDEIDEEIEEFLNSSGISASEDFTKDETVSEAASLKVDYVEKV